MSGIMMSIINNVPSTVVPVVTSGLKLYYDPGNTASYNGGSTINDLSGNNINGTVVGSPTVTSNWFALNGTSQYIMSGDVNSAKGTSNAHTVEVWVKPSAACAGWVDRDSASPLNSGYRATGLEIYSAGPFYLANTLLWNGTNTRMGGGTVSLNSWYQIVRTYNGTSATAYVNKVAASPTTFTWSSPPSAWYIGFGAYTDASFFATGAYFNGSYGVMRVYNRALSSSEVTQNYNATRAKYGL